MFSFLEADAIFFALTVSMESGDVKSINFVLFLITRPLLDFTPGKSISAMPKKISFTGSQLFCFHFPNFKKDLDFRLPREDIGLSMMVFCADNEVKMTALYLVSTSVHFEYYFSALLFSNEIFCIFVCEMEVCVSGGVGVRTSGGAKLFPSFSPPSF
jgi:hypothetical protein